MILIARFGCRIRSALKTPSYGFLLQLHPHRQQEAIREYAGVYDTWFIVCFERP